MLAWISNDDVTRDQGASLAENLADGYACSNSMLEQLCAYILRAFPFIIRFCIVVRLRALQWCNGVRHALRRKPPSLLTSVGVTTRQLRPVARQLQHKGVLHVYFMRV